MSKIKLKIEAAFNHLGHGIYQHRLKALIGMLILISCLASQLINLTVDTSFEGMLHENNSDRMKLNAFRDQFRGSELIVLMIESPDIFSVDFLNRLNALHKDIDKNVPFLSDVNSLINARRTYAENDTLLVDELIKDGPVRADDIPEIRNYVLSNPFFQNYIISADGTSTAIILETQTTIHDNNRVENDLSAGFDDTINGSSKPHPKHYFSEKENTQVVQAIEGIIKRHTKADFTIAVTGSPIIVEAYNRCTQKDMGFLIILSSLAMILFLALLFKRISGVVFPLLIVQSALVSTLGLMAIGNVSISIMTIILPSFIISVGVADAIHVLAIFYQRLDQGDSKEDAIAYALSHSGLAIVMTSLTTAAGLMSFSLAELTAIGDLGMYAAAGVILALVYTVVMLPAMLSLIPLTPKHAAQDQNQFVIQRVLSFFINFSTTHPVKIILISFLLFIMAGWYIFKINFSHDTLDYFPEDMTEKKDLISIDKRLNGNLTLEVIIDTHKKDSVCDPEFLNQLESTLNEISSMTGENIFVGKTFSLIDILKETNQALHDNDSAYYTIPQDRKMIVQELLLFESSGAKDLERFVDSNYSKLRISIKIPWVDLVITDTFIAAINQRLQQAFRADYDITITGLTALMGRTLPIALESMTKSYIIAFFVISLLMIILVGDLKTGILSMIPNLLPILFALGIMGLANIPMDLSALMIGSIAIGLVVDDTMHFMYNFRKYFLQTGNVRKAIETTMLGTGRALLVTTLVLSSNFFVFTLATLNNLTIFGAITGLTVLLALLTDFLVAPALLVLVYKK